jgi:quinolinate synthase
MKRTTLRSVRDALRLRRHEIVVAADVADDARRAIERMLAVGRDAGG